MEKNEINDNLAESDRKKSKAKNTLSDYIENNSKLISVLGVFTALTVFTNNLPIKQIGYVLSFVFLTITIIIWIELWTKFPPQPSSLTLVLFENALNFSILGIVLYWLVAYREIWRVIMVFPIWVIIMVLISLLISKYKLFEKITGYKIAKYRIVRIVFGLIIIILFYLFSIFIASIISEPINKALDSINLDIDDFLKI